MTGVQTCALPIYRQSLVFYSSLSRTTMSKPTKLSFPAMFKKLLKRKSLSPSSAQQQPSRTPNIPASLTSLVDRSATKTASLITHNIATSVAAPTSYASATPSHSMKTTSRSVAKDTTINALKLLLKVSSDIPGPGVKAALGGLLTMIERVQVCWHNM